MRKNSIKNRRINDEVRRSLSEIIRTEVHDPRISPFVSVVLAEVAPDLKTCRVYVSVLGDEESGRETLAGLKRASGFIRSALAHDINLRNTPELTFILDSSIAYGVDMSRRIDDVIARDNEVIAARNELEGGGEEEQEELSEEPEDSGGEDGVEWFDEEE